MNVRELFNLRRTPGTYGIEIEVEGKNVGEFNPTPGWSLKADGSLRDGYELVLRKPVERERLPDYLMAVVKRAKSHDISVTDTGRGSVHVHYNMQEQELVKVVNFMCAYLIFEEVLVDYCGDHRVGNLFCLRVADAEGYIDHVCSALRDGNFPGMCNDEVRYSSMNIAALSRFGSLEFRAMRSTIDPDIILEWVDLLTNVFNWSQQFDNPRQLIESFSVTGPDGVYNTVFGLESPIAYNEEAIYRGVRQAQLIAYATDNWELDPWLSAKAAVDELPWRGSEYEEQVLSWYDSREAYTRNERYVRSFIQQLEIELEDENDRGNTELRRAPGLRDIDQDQMQRDIDRAREILNRQFRTERGNPRYAIVDDPGEIDRVDGVDFDEEDL